MMNKETSETSIFLIIFTIIAFMFLKEWFQELFVYIWRIPILGFLFPLIYLPKWITENGVFLWVHRIPENAQYFVEILMKSPEYIISKYEGKPLISNTNTFVTNLISPYLIIFILYYAKKINDLRSTKFKVVHTIETLIKDQSDTWPQIKPMVNIHPETISDLDEGPYAMCLEPRKFAELNGLLIKYENKLGEERFRLDEQKANDVFVKQLGRRIRTIDDFSQTERFIFAILIPKVCRDGKRTEKLLNILATSYTTEKKYSKRQLKKLKNIAIKETNRSIDEFGYRPEIQNLINQHYYINTLFPRLLEEATKDGVLSTASFVWLKPVEREIWYILNNVGRRSSWTEISGAWSHFNFEKSVERKLPTPFIDGAIEALDEDFRITSAFYDPIDRYNKN